MPSDKIQLKAEKEKKYFSGRMVDGKFVMNFNTEEFDDDGNYKGNSNVEKIFDDSEEMLGYVKAFTGSK